jgi:hypothetical protein
MKRKMKHTVLPTKELLILQAQNRMALTLLGDEKNTKDESTTRRKDASNIAKLMNSENPIIVDLRP